MYFNKRIKTILLILSLLLINTSFSNQTNLERAEVNFSGRIIDQSNNPVEDAVVNLGIKQLGRDNKTTKLKTVVLKSDSTGCFKLTNTGSQIYIRTIEKDGYDFIDKKSKLNFDNSRLALTSVASPQIFYMRKKGEPAFLLKNTFTLEFDAKNSTEYYLDLMLGHIWTDEKLEKTPQLNSVLFDEIKSSPNSPNILIDHADIVIVGKPSADKTSFEVSFTSMDPNGGIIASDELLYQAPAKGYTTMETVKFEMSSNLSQSEKHLYAKARNGKLYSRIDLFANITSDGLSIKAKSWTNPDGSPNLEYDQKFQKSQLTIRKDLMYIDRAKGTTSRSQRIRHQNRIRYQNAQKSLKQNKNDMDSQAIK